MKLKAGYKYTLSLVLAIAAAVLCTLPFLALKKDTLYIYTEYLEPSSKEQGFIRELKRMGVRIVVNSANLPDADSYALWFKNPEYADKIMASPAKENFLYTEAYYPLNWQNFKKIPVMLTPYREIYEHYMRSNVKSALMILGVDTSVFYKKSDVKKYQLIYSGDNNKISPVAEYLKTHTTALFLGTFWPHDYPHLALEKSLPEAKGMALSQTQKVVVYNDENTPEAKKVPQEIMEATACGALVFSSPNKAVTEMYGNSVIIYHNLQDLASKLTKPLDNISRQQTINAQKITTEKLSSNASAKRFKELLDWVKQNP